MFDGFSIDARARIVSVKFSGHLALQDLRSYIAALRRSPDFNSEFSEVVDLAEVHSTELDWAKSALLSEAADPFARESKRAFVVENDAIDPVVRIYQTLRDDGAGIRLFRSLEEAKRWLGETDM